MTMSDLGQEGGLWMTRAFGAFAGSAVSLVYLLPKSRREAASRLVTGFTCGLLFGAPVGLWLETQLGIRNLLSGHETVLTGSAAASLTAWWGLGVLMRAAERGSRRQ